MGEEEGTKERKEKNERCKGSKVSLSVFFSPDDMHLADNKNFRDETEEGGDGKKHDQMKRMALVRQFFLPIATLACSFMESRASSDKNREGERRERESERRTASKRSLGAAADVSVTLEGSD